MKVKFNIKALALLLIFLLCLISYSNSFKNGFFLDDDQYFFKFPTLNDVSTASLFYKSFKGFYRPFSVTFLKIELTLFQTTNPFGYHLVNFVLFSIVCWLFFLILLKLFENIRWALLSSCLYAIHPINNIFVNYKTASAVLIGILTLQLSLLLFLYYLERKKRGLYVLSLIFYAFSILSHETSAILPAYLLMICYFFKEIELIELFLIKRTERPFNVVDPRMGVRSDIKEKLNKGIFRLCLPYFILFFIYLFIRFNIPEIYQIKHVAISIGPYLATIVKLLFWYFGKLINPQKILFLWDEKIVDHPHWIEVIGCLMTLISIYIYCWIKGKKNIAAFSIVLFLTGLWPIVLGSFVYTSKTHTAMIEPHWFGFSSIGFFALMSSMLVYIRKHLNDKAWLGLICIPILLNISLTRKSNVFWFDGYTYSSYWHRLNELNGAPTAFLIRKEIELLDKGLNPRLYADCSEVANLAHLFFRVEESDTAIKYYEMALDMDEGCIYALYGLGLVVDDMGNSKKAEQFMLKALSYRPNFPPLYEFLIDFYQKQGRKSEALKVKSLLEEVHKLSLKPASL